MRGCILWVGMLFIACGAWAQNLLQNPDFEGTNQAWRLRGKTLDGQCIAAHPTVRAGKHSARIGGDGPYVVSAIEQTTGTLQPGLYELTAWVSGRGALSLIVRKQTNRSFTIAEDGWHQYSLLFELTEASACDLAIEVNNGAGQAYVDDVAFVPADDERQAAWKKQQDAQFRLMYIPSGYSAQRPAPLAQKATAAPPADVHAVAPITRKVIFYDAKYQEDLNIPYPERIARWYQERGFEIQSALALTEWMQARLDRKDAYGSVVVMCMGIVPLSIVDGALESCLLRRYMENGGRVVWMGVSPLSSAQGKNSEENSKCPENMSEKILGVTFDKGRWSGGAATITAAGKAWGLTVAGGCTRGSRKEEVTLSFSENAGQGSSAIWLKTLNPAYPLSGFICYSAWVNGSVEWSFDYFYKLALFTGTPVPIPKVERPAATVAPLQCVLRLRSGASDRRAYVRGETVSIQPTMTNTVSGPVEMRIRIVPGAPSMRVYDLSAERFQLEQYQRELEEFHAKSERLEPVFTKTFSLTLTAGKPGEVEPILLDTAGLAVGNYEVSVVIKGEVLPAPIRVQAPLALCAQPRFDRVQRYIRSGNPQNLYRLYDYVDVSIQCGLDTGSSGDAARQPLMDILLMEGRPFMVALETCHCLVEPKKKAGGMDDPRNSFGIALSGAKARTNVYAYCLAEATRLAAYPAFARVFECNDDWSSRGGWDYNTNNLAEFKAKTGLEAPAPEQQAQRPAGILKDDDPWLLWSAFVCRDIFGGLNDAERRAVTEGCPGSLIWMVPGGAMWPLFAVDAGMYPPYNFGANYGHNASGYYTYYGYWAPSLNYLYASEMARMANRDLPSWVMPDAGHDTRHYIRNITHLLLAAGVDGINYFAYSWLGTKGQGRAEHAELGRLVEAHGALLHRLKHAPKRIGLLAPFSEAIFDVSYGQHVGHVFGAMAMAHLDAEPVAEEEIDQAQHKVIALWNVKHLRESSVKALERYIQRGGIVLLDKDCAVPVNGAKKLEVSLLGIMHEDPERVGNEHGNEYYGNPQIIAQLKQTFVFLGAPEVDSSEDTTVVRAFVSTDAAKYVYAVQVDSREEFYFWRKNVYEPSLAGKEPPNSKEKIEAFKREHGMGANVQDTVMTVRFDPASVPAGAQVVDVYAGKALPVAVGPDGRPGVTVKTRRFGGTLLAVMPAAIDRVVIQGAAGGQEGSSLQSRWRLCGGKPLTVKRGEPCEFTVEVRGRDGKPLPGVQSLALTLTQPDGRIEREVNTYQVAEKGICKLTFTPARNHPAGKWILEARELFTGKQARLKFDVQ